MLDVINRGVPHASRAYTCKKHRVTEKTNENGQLWQTFEPRAGHPWERDAATTNMVSESAAPT